MSGKQWRSEQHWNGHTATVSRPLFAHPLAIREPTDEECERILADFAVPADAAPAESGRAMFNAVRSVLGGG